MGGDQENVVPPSGAGVLTSTTWSAKCQGVLYNSVLVEYRKIGLYMTEGARPLHNTPRVKWINCRPPQISLFLPLAMASNSTTYPPDINCNGDGSLDYAGGFEDSGCPVTSNMVNFLNLTGANYKPYLAAYCVNPPADDDCPFGYCPNSDIAGSLVRVASELAPTCCYIKLCC